MSKRILNELSKYKEINLFLRGIIPLIGFKSDIIYYERKKRYAGKSKYSIKKMFDFAWDGITSFSIKPLRITTMAGSIFALIGFLYGIYTIIKKFVIPDIPMGYSALMSAIIFFGGMTMLMLGLAGEYVGRTYISINNNPQYVIRETAEEVISRD